MSLRNEVEVEVDENNAEDEIINGVSVGLHRFIDAYASLNFAACKQLLEDTPEAKGEDGCPMKKPGNAMTIEAKCRDQGLVDLDDLRQLAKRTWLGDLFCAKVALRMENAFDSPTFDAGNIEGSLGCCWQPRKPVTEGDWKTMAPKEWRREIDRKEWMRSFHLKMSVATIQNVCSTHGVVSALLMTMNIGSFASMTNEEWDFYEKGIATERCERGGSWVDYSSTVEDCALNNKRTTEIWFVITNMIAASMLLIVLLFASGLYICVSLPNALDTRPDEVEAIVARFSGEFVTLNILFFLSIFSSGMGIVQLIQLKATSWDLVVAVLWISFFVGMIILGLAVWLAVEVYISKGMIKRLRSHNSKDSTQKDEDYKAMVLRKLVYVGNRSTIPHLRRGPSRGKVSQAPASSTTGQGVDA